MPKKHNVSSWTALAPPAASWRPAGGSDSIWSSISQCLPSAAWAFPAARSLSHLHSEVRKNDDKRSVSEFKNDKKENERPEIFDRHSLSCAASSEGTSPANPDITLAAARQCLPSMYWPWKWRTSLTRLLLPTYLICEQKVFITNGSVLDLSQQWCDNICPTLVM